MPGFGLRKRKGYAALSLLVALFLIAACGGGGGGGGGGNNTTNNAALSGDYRGGVIGFDSVGPWNDLIDVTFDGNGQFTGTSAEEGPISGTYTVRSDNVLTADNEAGQLSQDGAIFHLVDTDASDLSISIGIKKSSGMSVADLDGTYHTFVVFQEFGYDFDAQRYSFVFDSGTGSFDYSGLSNPDTGSELYTVEDDGAIDLDQIGEGQVSENGDIFFFAGPGYLAIGIRQSTGMTNADLTGSFHAIALTEDDYLDDGAGSLSAGRGNISSDGSGNVTITPIDPPGTASTATGTVDGNGTITGTPNIGQLSPDGEFFIMADDGTLDMDEDYEIIIGILKP